jgi:NAD(P)-dependent dehydrogenase (short-subunit alcohol dehydrogenase family)
MRSESALVIGAGSSIAQALIDELLQTHVNKVVGVSRHPMAALEKLDQLICDYSEESITQVVASLRDSASSLRYVFVCNGILHDHRHQPEKRLEDLDAEALTQLFQVNAVLPALWLKALLPLLHHSNGCVLALFSARVGSIGDNRKGGWYSYRASKAALNMLVRTPAVEYARRAPAVKLLAYHPGTVDTALSRPFQRHVPTAQLLTAAAAAQKLIAVVSSLTPDGEASFLDWSGKQVPW